MASKLIFAKWFQVQNQGREESRDHAKFRAVEEAGRRIYMTIAGHRTPQHKHVENHQKESYWMTRDTDPEELVDLQTEIDASNLSNLDSEFQLAVDQDAA